MEAVAVGQPTEARSAPRLLLSSSEAIATVRMLIYGGPADAPIDLVAQILHVQGTHVLQTLGLS